MPQSRLYKEKKINSHLIFRGRICLFILYSRFYKLLVILSVEGRLPVREGLLAISNTFAVGSVTHLFI